MGKVEQINSIRCNGWKRILRFHINHNRRAELITDVIAHVSDALELLSFKEITKPLSQYLTVLLGKMYDAIEMVFSSMFDRFLPG